MEQEAITQAAIAQILEQFETGRAGAEQEIDQIIREDPVGFCREGLELLGGGEPLPGAELLANALLSLDAIVAEFCDPRRDLGRVKRAAQVLHRFQPALDARLLRSVWETRTEVSTDALTRVLDVVASFSDGKRVLPVVIQFLRSPNERVRSKAALLAARGRSDAVWMDKWLRDPDARIRANAVEAMWREPSASAVALFHKAAADPHHRVQANAYIGMHLAGLRDGIEGLNAMAVLPGPAHRAAACWAMGYLQDPVFVPLLASLVGSTHGVGFNAVRALARIRRAQQEQAGAEPLLEKVS